MARLLFHCDEINERGSAAALFEYISYCQLLGHEVTWAYNLESPNRLGSLAIINQKFETIGISNFERFAISAQKNYDWVYFLKKGTNDGLLIPRIPNNVHAIFQYYQPHGDSYAYISEWLARAMARSHNEFIPRRLRPYFPYESIHLESVPFSVDMPKPTGSMREEYGIPAEAKVCLRFGGLETFDIPWVKKTLVETLDDTPELWFLGVNTEKFTDHKRAIFAPAVYGLQAKANLISSSDFVLHARRQGESFGMTILETMQSSKPILSWFGGWDRNHVALLERNSLFLTPFDLRRKIKAFGATSNTQKNLEVANEFRPNRVFPKFKSVFGQDIL
jgi:hypothetical protein